MTDMSYGCLGDVLARALVADWGPAVARRRVGRVQAVADKLDQRAPPAH
jgi:hypothetical protein